jgi:hypothetical protein
MTTQEQRDDFEKMLKTHDWWYKMSDSIKTFDKGEKQEYLIKQACKDNAELTAMYENYKTKTGM